MCKISTLALFISFLFLISPDLKAQDYTIDVQHIGIEDGLLHRNIESVFEDSNGFLWIGSTKGLQRYDGHNFKTWTKANQSGLIYNITAIGEDDEGWLWLWNNDIQRFIFLHPVSEEILTVKEKFGDEFPISRGKDESIDWENPSIQLPKNSQGQLYFGLNDGSLITYDSKNGFLIRKVEKNIPIRIELIDQEDNIWVQSNFLSDMDPNQKGLYKLSPTGKILLFIPLEPGYQFGFFSKTGEKIYFQQALLEDIGATSKILEVDTSNEYKEIPFENVGPLSLFAFNNNFLLRSKGQKWKLFDKTRKEILFELDISEFPTSLFDSFYPPFVDSRGLVWIFGQMGVYKLSFGPSLFKTHFALDKNEKETFENSARGIYVNSDSIFVNLERSKTARSSKNESTNWSLLSNEHWARPMLEKDDKSLLIGYSDYISNISNSGEVIDKWYSQDTKKLNGIWSLQIDDNGILWCGSGRGLVYKNKDQNYLNFFQSDSSNDFGFTMRKGAIQNMIPAENGNIWFCSWTGLYLFDPTDKKILARYGSDEKGANYLPSDIFYYLHKDEQNIYWIGTADGLIRWEGPAAYDRSKDRNHRLFTRSDGFSNDVIYAIFEDDHNRLWMSSDYGIMSMNKESYEVQVYLEKDGISHIEFNRTSQFQAKDGTIYFGGLNGVTSFHPKDFITQEKDFAKMQIADFEIFQGKEEKLVNQVSDIRKFKTIVFHPDDRFFRLKFVLPTFEDPTQILYAWKIDGVDEHWNYQKENNIQIGVLPYGNHTLRVKGQSGGGGWSPHELAIDVKVLKPFYLRTWFILLSLLALIIGVLGFLKVRTNVLKREISKATLQIQNDKKTIEQQAVELKQLDQLKSRFFANVSHELRTPLSLMIGPIKMLLKNKSHNPDDKKLLNFVHRNSVHLKKLVTEILDLSKLESNKMELQVEPVEFYSYIKNHLIQFYSFDNGETLNVNLDFPDTTELHLLLDKNKFEKIINNFLSNALKFTPKTGAVNLKIEQSNTQATLIISDTGRGIHPDDLPHIFDRFYQSNQANTPLEGGTGIGLSFCKELAELMNGSVWAESKLGVGSKFFFQFPLKRIDAPTVKSKSPIAELYPIPAIDTFTETNLTTKGKTILIVEDNVDLRSYYEMLLKDYQVVLTANGKEALEYMEVAEQLPQLVLSDLMMPVMDGMQFLTQFKSNSSWRNIPVIMLTAKTNRLVKLKALRIGIDDYMTKPFDDEELLIRIENLLSNYMARVDFHNEKEIEIKSKSIVITKEEIEWLEQFEKYIIDNIDNDLLSVDFLSKEFAMSKSTLLRQLRKTTGLTVTKYIQEHRLNYARDLLESKAYKTIAQVAAKVGFKNTNAFSRSFKNRFGNTPSELILN